MKDVAELAGVSIKTVSRVANSEGPVTPATRAKVQSVMDVLGFERNEHAAALGRTRRRG
ncbi:LacI family DNA-binding transcriptional regulator [Pedococcus sp. 5OH_020]|uniref:LacI family DNA-binding transcriptional regulator n=1 Tax=Pedococcus sp. 5OH_020 TaxID=2989814 RepID=UPI0022E9F559|nr:LacI family DNA-binding transcriptional regulator [Pedococcus sp. 5OH_020]